MWIGTNEFDHSILALLKQQRQRPVWGFEPGNCTLPRKSGPSSLPNQVFAGFVMLPRAPITIGIVMNLEAPSDLKSQFLVLLNFSS